jgi:hypothetical protein
MLEQATSQGLTLPHAAILAAEIRLLRVAIKPVQDRNIL